MNETIDQSIRWESVLKELKEALEGHHADLSRVQALRRKVCRLCGSNLPPREMRKHVPDDVNEQVRNLFVGTMARGDAPLAHDLLWYVGITLGVWPRVHPQETAEHVIESLAREAVSHAETQQQFGIACALAELARDTDQADRLRPLARERNQRIALDYTSSPFERLLRD